MAKNDDDEFDLDSDDFGEFDDGLGDIDGMGDVSEPPPKNTREAVSRGIKNTSFSFMEDFTDDKIATANEVLKHSVPESLSKEHAAYTDATDTVKDEVEKAKSAVQKEAKTTLSLIKKIAPESEKVQNVLSKIGDVLDINEEPNADKGPSKEQIEKENRDREILEALGEQQDANAKEQLLKDQIELNRHKSNIELMNVSVANLTAIRKFNNEITNNYYRKSLEIGLKSLYVQKENLEVIKTGFDIFKNQFEALVQNTGLPDMLKVRSKEALVYKAKTRMLDSGLTAVSGMGALGNFKKNFKDMAETTKDKLIESLSGANEMLGMAADDSLGMSKEQLIGTLLAGVAKEKIGGKLGKLIEKTDLGKEAILKVKDYTGDLSHSLSTTGQSLGGPLQSVFDVASELTNKSKRDKTTVVKKDLDDVTIFDNRAKDSLVKVIPGLLAKIHNEVSAIRKHSKIDINAKDELRFDNNTDTFISKDVMKIKYENDFKRKLENTVGVTSKGLIEVMTNPNNDKFRKQKITFSGREIKEIRSAIVKYLMDKGPTKASVLKSNKFFKYINNKDLITKLKVSLKYALSNPNDLDSINSGLSSLLTSLAGADFKNEIKELSDSGNLDILDELNIMGKDKITGNRILDNDLVNKKILNKTTSFNDSWINDKVKKDEHDKLVAEENKKKFFNKKADDIGTTKHASGGLVKLGRSKAIQYIVYKYKLKRNDAAELYKKLSSEDIVTKNTIDEYMTSNRYTGDGAKTKEAGIVHKGEYVITKDNVTKLVKDVSKGDYKELKTLGDKITKDVKKVSSDAYKYAKTSSPDKVYKDAVKLIQEANKQIGKTITSTYTSTLETVKTSTNKYIKSIGKTGEQLLNKGKELSTSLFNKGKEAYKNFNFSDDDKKAIEKAMKLSGFKGSIDDFLKTERGAKLLKFAKSKELDKKYNSAKTYVTETIPGVVNAKLKTATLSTANKRILRKLYNNLKKSNKISGTFGEFLASDIGEKAINQLPDNNISTILKDTGKLGKEYISKGNKLANEGLAHAKDTKLYKDAKYLAKVKLLNKSDIRVINKLMKQQGFKGTIDDYYKTEMGYKIVNQLTDYKLNNGYYKDKTAGYVNDAKTKANEGITYAKTKANETVNKLNIATLSNTNKRILKNLYKSNVKHNKFKGTFEEFLTTESATNVISRLSGNILTEKSNKLYNKGNELANEGMSYVKDKAGKAVNKVTDKLLQANIKLLNDTDVKAIKKAMKHNKFKGTIEEFYNTELGHTLVKQLTIRKMPSFVKTTTDTFDKYSKNSISENFNIAKNAIKDRIFKDKYEGIDFIKDYKDLSEDEQKALKAEFFSSEEFKLNPELTFNDWLARSKSIRPEANTISELMKKFNPIRKQLTKLSKLKDELIDEVMGKITGTGLKELKPDEEDSLREEFFNSKEYQDGLVTDFDIWLKTFGYRRNGTGLLGKLKRTLSVKNILKHTRALDKKIFFGASKLVGKGIKNTAIGVAKSPIYATKGIVGGTAMAGRGIANVGRAAIGLNKLGDEALGGLGVVNKYVPKSMLGKALLGGAGLVGGAIGKTVGGVAANAVGGVLSAPNTILKGVTGYSLAPSDMKTNVVRAKKLFNNPFKNKKEDFNNNKEDTPNTNNTVDITNNNTNTDTVKTHKVKRTKITLADVEGLTPAEIMERTKAGTVGKDVSEETTEKNTDSFVEYLDTLLKERSKKTTNKADDIGTTGRSKTTNKADDTGTTKHVSSGLVKLGRSKTTNKADDTGTTGRSKTTNKADDIGTTGRSKTTNKADDTGTTKHVSSGLVKLGRSKAIQYIVYKYKLKRNDAVNLYKKIASEDIVTKNTIDEYMTSNRYTGTNTKYTPADIVHKGEYVITKEKVAKIVNEVTNNKHNSLKVLGSKMSKSKAVKDTPAMKSSKSNNEKSKMDELIEAVKENNTKKKKVFGDTDGDGVREGSWKSRLKELNSKAAKTLSSGKKSVMSFIKDKSSNMSTSTKIMLAVGAISGLMKTLGVNTDDLKKAFNIVKDTAVSIWDTLKWGFGKLVDGFRYIKTLPDSISLSIRRALPTAFGGISEEDAKKEEAIIKAKRDGTYVEPDAKPQYDENGELMLPKGDDINAKHYAIAAGGTMAAGVAGHLVKKAASLGIVKPIKLGFKAIKGTAKLTGKAIKGTAKLAGKAIGKKATSKAVKKTVSKAAKTLPKKTIASKILSTLKSFKGTILKRFGKKAGKTLVTKLMAKIAARAVPFLGWSLLLWDAGWIIKYMSTGLSLKSAISKQILGFDLFNKDDVPEDVDMSPEDNKNALVNQTNKIKPINNTYLNTTKHVNNTTYTPGNTLSKDDDIDIENIYKPVNNVPAKKITNKDILKEFDTSTPFSKGRFLADLIRDEGVVLHKYKDHLGYDTIGVGHLLTKGKGKPIKPIIGRDTDTITKPEAYKILAHDANAITKELYKKLPWLTTQPEVVQRNINNMAFNLGVTGLLNFRKALKHLKEGNYLLAGKEFRNSKWYKQVGARAQRIVYEISSLGIQSTPKGIRAVANRHVDNTNKPLTVGELAKRNVNNSKNTIENSKQRAIEHVANLDLQKDATNKQITNDSIKHLSDSNKHLKESINIQAKMLSVLGDISHRLNDGLDVKNLKDIPIANADKTNEDTPSRTTTSADLPRPAVNLERKKYAS